MKKSLRSTVTLSAFLLISQFTYAQTDTITVKTRLLAYYAAINRHQYSTAFAFWEENGEGRPASFSSFKRGFQHTARTSVTMLNLGRFEPAAGSVYVTIPVLVEAKLMNGQQQHFTGAYVLRRANGPAIDNHTWRIYSAKLTSVREPSPLNK